MRVLSNTIKGRGVVLVVVVCLFGSVAFGQPWLGSGTGEDPYQIWTAEDMNAIGADENYWGAHFELMADIDLSAYTGTSFNTIGNGTTKFRGVFDGNGHTISNFTGIQGLFGVVSLGGTIQDLGLIDPNVIAVARGNTGSLANQLGDDATISGCYVEGGSVTGYTESAGTLNSAGGLVGKNVRATITNCYSNASVSGNENVGGLVGYIYDNSMISSCYATGVVSGNSNIGGLVGYSEYGGPLANCYSAASVSGNNRVGGLVGFLWVTEISKCYSTGSVSGGGGLVGSGATATVYDSFWDIQTSGQSTSAGGKGKTTAEMQTVSTFIGWGGCGNEGVWTLDEGNDYPRLWWENQPGQTLPAQLSDFVAGAGTEDEAYLIYTAEQLNLIGLFACEFDKHFKLMADIDLSGYSGTKFNIIGNDAAKFTGVFDGNGHRISNFSYSSTGRDEIGLFGFISGENAEVRDLGLVNPDIDAGTGDYVGSLVGWVEEGTISCCYVGGGSVSGYSSVGGLVGSNGGTVANCYSTGSVVGDSNVGGLVGTLWAGEISKCYSAGSVSGGGTVGGLLGYKEAGQVTDSFWDTETSGQETSAGGTGLITVLMQTAFIFTSYGWDFVGESANGTEDIWRLCVDGTSYPQLNWQFVSFGDFSCPDGVDWADLSVLCGEWLFELIPADVAPDGGDGIVNFLDWAIFAEGWQITKDIYDLAEFADQWLKTGSNYLIADIAPAPGGDGIINFLDFAALANNWLQ